MKWLLSFGLCIIVSYNACGQDDNTANNFTTLNQSDKITQSGISNEHFLSYSPLEPVAAYSNDFENERVEIFSSEFVISAMPGINGQVLHTPSPYPKSDFIDSTYDLTAQIMHPVVLHNNCIISFDEIVLVEPESISTGSDDKDTYDYVVIEASKDWGKSWIPISEKYNSGIDQVWQHVFSRSIFNLQSYASGSQSIFKEKNIELIDNINFFEGDTIQIRFKLSSDYSINGWGWAIDNIEIRQDIGLDIELDESRFQETFNIYPNPCKNQIYIDSNNNSGPSVVDILIVNQTGSIMYREEQISRHLIRNKSIDISTLKSGLYSLIITDRAYYRKTKKIVKL